MLYEVNLTKNGAKYLCEAGGAGISRGSAVIICGKDGEKLKPFFPFSKPEPNGNHMAFRIQPGIYIVVAKIQRHETNLNLYELKIKTLKVLGESHTDRFIDVEEVGTEVEYILGTGYPSPGLSEFPEYLHPAILCCINKAWQQNCTMAFFYDQQENPSSIQSSFSSIKAGIKAGKKNQFSRSTNTGTKKNQGPSSKFGSSKNFKKKK